MVFKGLLFPDQSKKMHENPLQKDSAFLYDLNIDTILEGVLSGKQEYDLEPFFLTMLHDKESIIFRQNIYQDIRNPLLFKKLKVFEHGMRTIRSYRENSQNRYCHHQKTRWMLDAASLYCTTVRNLQQALEQGDITSSGLISFLSYLQDLTASTAFVSLEVETRRLSEAVASIQYCYTIDGDRVRVKAYEDEPELTELVVQSFERFRQRKENDKNDACEQEPGMNHVEEAILNLVARLFPEVFQQLESFYSQHQSFCDPKVEQFDREIQFYLSYAEYINQVAALGVSFCIPQITFEKTEIRCNGGVDLALAVSMADKKNTPVPNDFSLQGTQRMLVVTGPNQGGKTTYARMFGQLHYIASLGLPVPASNATLFMFDTIFTLFGRVESHAGESGALKYDLVQMKKILDHASGSSIIILNEVFSSTTLFDATMLAKRILERISRLDCPCVMVTFIDEIASFSDIVVSMVAEVENHNQAQRTFRIVAKPADGLAYARAIAGKYHLTYEAIIRRLAQ